MNRLRDLQNLLSDFLCLFSARVINMKHFFVILLLMKKYQLKAIERNSKRSGFMSQRRIQELDLLRTVAIIMVVFVHAITRTIEIHEANGGLTEGMETALLTLRLFATFGTPIFVFLSEFLLSYSYKEGLPGGFFKKRIKYILLPYVSMGVLYALVMTYEGGGMTSTAGFSEFFKNVGLNLMTGFYRHGYFIILIFQFYLLHYFLHSKLKNMNIKTILGASLTINVAYLLFFHGIQKAGVPYSEELVAIFTWGTAPAWIFYFACGYVLGRKKESFHALLERMDRWVIPFVALSGGFLAWMNFSGVLTENSSKRFDMIFFTAAMFLLLYRFARRKEYSVKFTEFISRYSFGIYLLHMFYLFLMAEFMIRGTFRLQPVISLIILTVGSTALSIATTNFLSQFTWSAYVVGRLEKKMPQPVYEQRKEPRRRRERTHLTEY